MVQQKSPISSFIFCWSMNIQNNDMTPDHRPLSIMYDIVSLTNSTLLTADMILLCPKILIHLV
jgi:hypothetical protein